MSQRKIVLIGAASVLGLIGFGLLFTSIVGGGGSGAANQLNLAMTWLDEGRWDLAGRVARDLQSSGFDCEENSAWHYVQGVAKLKRVEDNLDTPQNRRVLLDATEHLQTADRLGFPTGYIGKGKFYLGWCQFHTYHWDQAATELAEVDRLWPQRRSDTLRMKMESQLRKTPPDVAAAKATLAAWEAIPGMSAAERAQISLAHANLAFIQHDLHSCEELLASITGNSREAFEAMLLRTRWRLTQAAEERGLTSEQRSDLLQQAADIARQLKVAADTPPEMRRQAALISGKILRQQGKLDEALSTFSGARQSSPQSAEAIAAGIEEVEILIETEDPQAALSTLHYVLQNTDDLGLFNESWMTVPEFRGRLVDIGHKFRDINEFDKAISMARHMAPAFPQADSVRMQAEALEHWAEVLASRSPSSENLTHAEHRELVRDKHQAAATLYEQLAQLELRSREYPDILWQAITACQHAGDLNHANELLIDYLRHEDRAKRPRGFLALGRNYINSAQWNQAIAPLERCRIEHPTHPISFEARLLAAKANYELDQLDQALELLNENLSGSATALRPSSDIWRDSLYQLAITLFRQGDELLLGLRHNPAVELSERESQLQSSQQKFLEVVDQLGGFVTRYPDDPRHFDARYLIAKSHRLAAEAPQQIALANPNIVDHTRRNLMQQRRQSLEQAVVEYSQLRRTITQHQESLILSDQTSALIRNCYFGEADTLYELGRWDEAISAYQNVASRFLNKPESLEALLQMSQCHRKLGQKDMADRILVQAEQVLLRIPPELDTQFVSLTRTNRVGWTELLGSLRSWD